MCVCVHACVCVCVHVCEGERENSECVCVCVRERIVHVCMRVCVCMYSGNSSMHITCITQNPSTNGLLKINKTPTAKLFLGYMCNCIQSV